MFASKETSRTKGRPVLLYRFKYAADAGAIYAYTDHEQAIQFNDVVYAPTPIDMSAIVAQGSLDRSAITVNLPRDAQIATLFNGFPPSFVVGLQIFQGHVNDPDGQFLSVWTGRVLGANRDGGEAELTCEPASTTMQRAGLRRHYQYTCPHALFGDQCKANKGAATSAQVIESVTKNRITFAVDWVSPETAARFLGGMVQWSGAFGNELRTVLQVVNDRTLVLSGPPTGLESGSVVSVIFGCDHQMTGCNLHNNIQNFGGQPWIPTSNPIGTNKNSYY